VKALSEELENPMNVHRWRKLEGSDPATYEMIQKIQTLQKRLIMKTEEVVEKDLLIQEKEKLYVWRIFSFVFHNKLLLLNLGTNFIENNLIFFTFYLHWHHLQGMSS